MKEIILTAKQLAKLMRRALKEQRKKSAPPTRKIESKKLYKRKSKNGEGWDI